MVKIAILDDYQNVARDLADWSVLPADSEIVVFNDYLAGVEPMAERLAEFDIVGIMRERTPFPRALFEKLPKLKLLVTTGARNASIDLAAAADHGVTVSGTGGSAQATAELAWGLILGLMRRIPFEDRAMREGHWQTTLGHDLSGKTLGLLGLGRLGSQVAKVGIAFGMDVVGWSQNLTAERAAECGAARAHSLDDLLRAADVVSIHLVLSDRTRDLIGAREFGLMKPTAYLVNTSRGPIVNETALVDAMQRDAIAGAALDVYDTEPLPADHPLRGLENTVLTPHIGYVTEATYRVFYTEMVEDIAAYLAGEPIRVIAPKN